MQFIRLLRHKEQALALNILGKYGLEAEGFALLTLHRPSNVDVPEVAVPSTSAAWKRRLPMSSDRAFQNSNLFFHSELTGRENAFSPCRTSK
jgi:hypothetical protein